MPVRYLKKGKHVAEVKIVTRTDGNVDWFRNLAKELEVSQGAVFDTMIKIAKDSKLFKHKVKRTWHEDYSL